MLKFFKYSRRVGSGEAAKGVPSSGSAIPSTIQRLTTILFTGLQLLVLLSVIGTPATAAKKRTKSAPPPKAQLLDAMSLENDDGGVCLLYGNEQKYYAVVSRVDGTSLKGKAVWDLKALNKELATLGKSIRRMGKPSSLSGRKKLKKAQSDKSKLSKAKAQLVHCERNRKVDSSAHPIHFAHVKRIIAKRCMNCHGVLGWKNDETFFLETGRVAPHDLEQSPFYSFLSNNPEGYQPGYMPKGSAPLADVDMLLLSRWILSLPGSGTPEDPGDDSPEGQGRALYNNNCSVCHGPLYSSAKWGKTEAEIRTALHSIPQMRYLALTDEQIRNIALALSKVQPPIEGSLSVRNVTNVTEGNLGDIPHTLRFEIALTGKTSRSFNVGYVTSSGTALADSDFVFSAGTLHFEGADGEKQYVDVEVIGDAYEEADESVYLDIGGVTHGGVRVSNSTAVGTIINDDALAVTLPPLAAKLRAAYGFNGTFADLLHLSEGLPKSDPTITADAKVGSGALALTNSADYLQIPARSFATMSSFTFAGWVKWENPTSQIAKIFDFGTNTANYISFQPRDTSNRCRFELRVASAAYTLQCNANVTLPANQWVHVATTFNSDTDEMKVYFNGQQVASRSAVTATISGVVFSDNSFGRNRLNNTADFAGKIDEAAIWDAALSPQEIAQVMALDKSIAINSAVEVRLNGQLVPNGSAINMGIVAIGNNATQSLTISNHSNAGLALLGAPNVVVGGRHASEFTIKHQPWPWQALLGAESFTAFSLRFTPSIPGDKYATVSISNSDLKDGNYAFGVVGRATGEIAIDAPSDGSNEQLTQGQSLYAVNCASCHGALASSQKLGATTDRVSAALNPTSGIPQMRSLGISTDQMALIVLALNTPIAKDANDDMASNVAINIGTAPFVASVLTDVFLPEDSTTFTTDDTTIKNKILEDITGLRANQTFLTGRVAFIGGRCEHFDTLCNPEGRLASQSPAPNTIRTGLIIRTCDEVLSLDRAVDTALSKISRSSSAPIDNAAVQDMYDLFFPGREVPAYLTEIISNFPKQVPNFTPRDNWRFALNLICVSNGWEGR